jgi:hypothetical protein
MKRAERTENIAACAASHYEFRTYHRYSNQEYEADVYKQECPSAMSPCFVRKTPDIAEANG